MAREIVVEETVVAVFEAAGWYQRKMMFVGVKGCPDRFFWRKGLVAPIEFKSVNKQPDGHQVRRHRELREHGQPVYVIDTIEDGIALCVKLTAESDRRVS